MIQAADLRQVQIEQGYGWIVARSRPEGATVLCAFLEPTALFAGCRFGAFSEAWLQMGGLGGFRRPTLNRVRCWPLSPQADLSTMTAQYSPQSALEVLKDEDGSVTMGWVGERVFYSRFAGSLSADLGMKHVARLGEGLLRASSVLYFSDASALYEYDLLARSAFTRLVLENRRKLSRLVMLTWSTGVTPSATAFASAVGDSVTLLTDPTAFEKLLVAAAPLARQKIDSRPWVNASTTRSVRG